MLIKGSSNRKISGVGLGVMMAMASPALAATGDHGGSIVPQIHIGNEPGALSLNDKANNAALDLEAISQQRHLDLPALQAIDFNIETISAARLDIIGPEPLSEEDAGTYSSNDVTFEILPNGENVERPWSYHVPREFATHSSFGSQVGTIKTEALLFLGYFSLQSGKKLFRETAPFHFHDEGWFGKNTGSLGLDKILHAFDTYLIAEILHMRLHEKTNASQGDALTAAALASALMAFNELSDGIEPDSGYSMQDITMNTLGAAFSVLRNTVPGMRDKVSFKIEIMPNDNIYSYRGKAHYEQQRYMMSLKGRGFKALDETPFHYLDLQFGYYGSDFLKEDIRAGKEPKRHLFVGVGLNLGEVLFGKNKTDGFSKAADSFLDYMQLPYTSVRVDQYGGLNY